MDAGEPGRDRRDHAPGSTAVRRLSRPGDQPDSSATVRKVVDLPDGLAEALSQAEIGEQFGTSQMHVSRLLAMRSAT
jgi:hypothetical protein